LEEIEDEKLTADGQIDQSDFILFFLVKTGKISRCGIKRQSIPVSHSLAWPGAQPPT
jgi:hypothetical protein